MKIKYALIMILSASITLLVLRSITPTFSNPLTLFIDVVNAVNGGIIYFILVEIVLFGMIIYRDFRRVEKI